MYTIEQLILEHENISRMTRVMRAACLHILEGIPVDTIDFRRCIAFIRTYADQNHHGKEEAFLFKEMQSHLCTAAQTLVQNGMLVEHDLGRLYVKQLEDAVTAFELDNSSENKLDILANAMAYNDLLHRHIERENGAVFPFAERGLPPEVLDLLDAQTRTFETNSAKEREAQLSVLAALELKYGREETFFKGESPCPCKRKSCPRFADCDACYKHHHLPGKKLPTTCERIRAKQTSDKPDKG